MRGVAGKVVKSREKSRETSLEKSIEKSIEKSPETTTRKKSRKIEKKSRPIHRESDSTLSFVHGNAPVAAMLGVLVSNLSRLVLGVVVQSGQFLAV